MDEKIGSRFRSLLNRPLFGTKVIPPGARIDPAQFPENDFPVYCRTCQYLLRGLPEGRCPECGELFDRGRLLVLLYIKDTSSHPGLRGTFLWVVGLMLILVGTSYFGLWGINSYLTKNIIMFPGSTAPTAKSVVGLGLGLMTLKIVIVCVWYRLYRHSRIGKLEMELRKKRRLVKQAWFHDEKL